MDKLITVYTDTLQYMDKLITVYTVNYKTNLSLKISIVYRELKKWF